MYLALIIDLVKILLEELYELRQHVWYITKDQLLRI